MSLTRSERSELIVEAIITMSLIFLLYLSALLIYRQAIDYKLNFFGLDTTLRHMLGLTRQQIIVSVYIFLLPPVWLLSLSPIGGSSDALIKWS